MRALALLLLSPLCALAGEPEQATEAPMRCTYSTYEWSVKQKKIVNRRKISKPYAEVTDAERAPEDPRCSVCAEDQLEVKVEGLPPVTVCKHHAAQVRGALEAIKASKFQVLDLTGYRVGKTRGPVVNGLRSLWSNHSFGTAIDINRKQNGLYNRCQIELPKGIKDLKGCKLAHGGAWDPQKRPHTTITPDSAAYQAFSPFWKWGGALKGPTRDFMHFSVTGE
ncbi:M15 family metallopeptidase [Myxococcota bacterium]|nr:M15 family metallopeptidase [Myxococcota bacterium]MBU1431468.1 M15 family metallopeptidase [Myxococcota bacterium]MBU1898540.1 M15 family metallopeptidase [Myxococcota bacterium]